MPDAPDLIALTDQAIEEQKQLARVLHAYFRALTDLGFTEDQALHLTTGYQQLLQTFAWQSSR